MTTLKALLFWLSTTFGGFYGDAVPCGGDLDAGTTFDLVDSAEDQRVAPPPASKAREQDDDGGSIYNGF